jgi:hypothetical protein
MTPPETFLAVVQHVLGQTFQAGGYELESDPMRQGRGLFRWGKPLAEGRYAYIEFQLLHHPDLSRFGVKLIQSDQANAATPSPQRHEMALPVLVWEHFGVQLLPSLDHWWAYRQPQDLAQSVLEAGQLLFGYGVPWLEGHEGV